jgi:ectoine hydroxylase-related dioxygenase (phytanoyl-CoA dioxygenase family)
VPKTGSLGQAQLGPHIDPFTAVVSAAIYLDDVGTHAGGFTLWPGSAQLLYPTMRQHRNFTPTETFGPTLQHIKDTITPIEFSGGAGDVILYHGLAVRTKERMHTIMYAVAPHRI